MIHVTLSCSALGLEHRWSKVKITLGPRKSKPWVFWLSKSQAIAIGRAHWNGERVASYGRIMEFIWRSIGIGRKWIGS